MALISFIIFRAGTGWLDSAYMLLLAIISILDFGFGEDWAKTLREHYLLLAKIDRP